MKYIVTSESPLWIKQTPEITGKNIGIVRKDNIIESLGEIDGYIKTNRGYILKDLDTISLVKPLMTAPLKAASPSSPLITATDNKVNASPDWGDLSDDYKYGADWYEPTFNTGTNNKGDPGTVPTPAEQPKSDEVKKTSESKSPQDIIVMHLDNLMKDDSTKTGMIRQGLDGIYGLPYQWMAHVDPRVFTPKGSNNAASENNYPGRVYTERIISKMPILLISPGKPKYNGTGDKTIAEIIKSEMNGEDVANELNQSNGIFYSFDYQLVQYFQYVNPILRLAAKTLNLDKIEFNGKVLTEYDWSQNYNKSIHGEHQMSDNTDENVGSNNESKSTTTNYVGKRSIAFYLDSDFSISDTISNSAGESRWKSKINGISDEAREWQFLMGFGASGIGMKTETMQKMKTKIEEYKDKIASSSNSGFWQTLVSTAGTLAEGGKLMFPNIWQDSSFSRGYNVKFKLVSPDYDNYSWYMNILVPLVHLICLTMPQKAENSFAYISPFLVRAFYKGMFNCNLGVITSLDISRGQETGWTQSGLPTIVEVNMNIQDLYDGIAMSKSTAGGLPGALAILKNPIYLDYIANMCGINLNEPDIRRTISYYKILIKGAVMDLPNIIEQNISQIVYNKILDIYGKMQHAGL